MPSKIIYVTTDPAHAVSSDDLDILTVKQQNALLEGGWFITKSEQRKIKHPKSHKTVAVERIELSNEHALSTNPQSGGQSAELSVSKGFEMLAQVLNQNNGPPGSSADGYLGRSMAGLIPGVKVTSSFAPGGAFGMGVDAAKAGRTDDACTFPEGTVPFGEWLAGYLSAKGKPDPECRLAMEEGRKAARGEKEDEVEIPTKWSRPNTRGYVAWVYAFKQAGGDVQSSAVNGNV